MTKRMDAYRLTDRDAQGLLDELESLELVERLRALAGCYSAEESTITEAADEIERLTAALKQATCSTCNGRGMVGGFVNAENGYQTDPCPDCSQDETGEKHGLHD